MRIYVSGHRGFVGSNVLAALRKRYPDAIIETSNINLSNAGMVDEFFKENHDLDLVIHCASRVGGIEENRKDNFGFLVDNVQINLNVMQSAVKYRTKRFINLASSCLFPKDFPIQPMKEEHLLNGPFEPTNEGYSIGKLFALKFAEMANKQTDTKFITLSPCNLIGPGDHFGSPKSHVPAALIARVWDCIGNDKPLIVYGSGNQRREFLHIYDLVDCILWAIENLEKTDTFLNVGVNDDVTINQLAQYIIKSYKTILGDKNLEIPIINDTSKPDGMNRKLLDSSKINALGWRASRSIEQSVFETVKYFLENHVTTD